MVAGTADPLERQRVQTGLQAVQESGLVIYQIAQHYCQIDALEVTYFPDCLPGIFNLNWAVCLGVADEDDS